MNRRHVPVVVVLAALLGLLAVWDAAAGDRASRATSALASREDPALPTADPPGVLTSTWYCAAGTAVEGGSAGLTVVVANMASEARSGTVTWFPAGAEPEAVPFELAGHDDVSFQAQEAVEADVVSAIVEVDGGDVVVEHGVTGPRGSDVAPCASSVSESWYLANGVTTRDASQRLYLFNPFPDDVVVDLSFDTNEGAVAPEGLQGLPVLARSTVSIDLTEFVRRREATATTVRTRGGRLVVDRVQSFDGSGGRRGQSLAVAAPAPAEVWMFPEGRYGDGLTERWHIYNPGDREALVGLELVPAEGDLPEPLDLTIPAGSRLTVDAAEAGRVAAGIDHTATARSLNGVPVVVERELSAATSGGRTGWSSTLGSPVAAEAWAFAVGQASDALDQWLVVHNPGAEAVTVDVVALAEGRVVPVEGLQGLPLGPAGRLALRIGEHIRRSPLPLLVTASGPVVVERDLYRVGAVGLSTVMGVPLAD